MPFESTGKRWRHRMIVGVVLGVLAPGAWAQLRIQITSGVERPIVSSSRRPSTHRTRPSQSRAPLRLNSERVPTASRSATQFEKV